MRYAMFDRITRPVLFGAYQLALLVGVVLLPVALVVGRLGVTLPVHRPVQALSRAYERAADAR